MKKLILVFLFVFLSGFSLRKSDVESAQISGATVSVVLNADAANRLEVASKEHRGQNMTLEFEGKVVGSPLVREEIKDGKLMLSGMTHAEAQDLVNKLNPKK